jgi:hypothetical protein
MVIVADLHGRILGFLDWSSLCITKNNFCDVVYFGTTEFALAEMDEKNRYELVI